MFAEEKSTARLRAWNSFQCAAHDERRPAFWLVLSTLASVALAMLWLAPGHGWGDDFAGYLLQAQSLVNAKPAQELQLNAHLMAASDWRAGPDAYPWGYPAILAALIWIAGQSLTLLKVVSVAAIGVATLATGLLAHASRLGLLAAICVAILVGMQPDLTSLANIIGSDALFLALTAVALLFAVLALDAPPRTRLWLMLTAAVFGSLSYFVRSNGVVTLAAVAAASVAVQLFGQRRDLRSIVVTVAAFGLVCAVLVGAYYALLPDGSFVHLHYLTLQPASLLRRSGDAVVAFGRFYPLDVLPDPLAYLAVIGVVALAVLGAFRLGKAGVLLALYSGGHLLLVTLFPYSGGQRYYLPVLLGVAILAMGGVEAVAQQVAAKLTDTAHVRVAGGTLVVLLFVGAVGANVFRVDARREKDGDGPYSPAATELFGYLRAQPDTIQPVAFFKPRALRYLAGKDALLVRTPQTARLVNSIVVSRGPKAAPWQLSEGQVAQLKDFRPAFHNEDFTLYVRAPRAAARSQPTLRHAPK
ncbi:MAG TPA: hypothetical protein VJQ52_12675 [Steroidobacteraceae bacterium]|nr:hypothetical protein [Steroidobacteraceae bacterium]